LHIMGVLVFSQYEGVLKPPKELYTGQSFPEATAVGDVNGDGHNDIVAADSYYFDPEWDWKVIVWIQDTSVTPHGLHAPVKYDWVNYAYDPTLFIEDMDEDGRNDVVINTSNGFGIFYQNGLGTLDAMQNFTSTHTRNWGYENIAVGDFNNDGRMDVVISSSNLGVGYLEVFLQNNSNQFTTPDIYVRPIGVYHIGVGDLNNDSLDDIVIGIGGKIAVFLQNAGGTLDAAVEYDHDYNHNWMAVGDVNNDNRDDVVLNFSFGDDADLGIFYQNAGGTLTTPPFYFGTLWDDWAIEIADVNRDGLNDIMLQAYGLRVLYQTSGGGMETDYVIYPTYGSQHDYSFDFGDINGDGWGDVVFPQAASSGVTINHGWNGADALVLGRPNGGQRYNVGSTIVIDYMKYENTANSIDSVDLAYSINGGSSWTTIENGVDDWWSDGSWSYFWTAPYIPSDNCLVRVTGSGIEDKSYYAFSIVDDGVDRVFVSSPNGGDSLVANTTYNITWYTTGTIANVKLEYSTNNGTNWTEIIASTPNDEIHTWTVPNAPSTQCLVRISDAADSNTVDTSDAVFTIYEPGTETITVTAPNGGESLTGGTTYTITWTYTGNIASVAVAYSTDNGANWTTIATVLNTGSYLWNVPNVSSTQCLVRVRNAVNSLVSDQSNSVFSIGSFGNETVTVLSPNGGEMFCIGRTATITWTTTGLVGNVSLQYSTNNGGSWRTIVASTANDGSHLWTVPNTPSSQCKVRVQEASDGDPTDTSNAVFSIIDCGATLSLTSPKGGEAWQVGSQHDITWISGDKVSSNVKLLYSTNNGTSWITITSSTANDGSCPWTIPNTPSTTCKVKIMDASNSSIYNISFGTFAIVFGSVEPLISLNRTHLYYGAMKSSTAKTPTQTITVTNGGYGTLKWQVVIYDLDEEDSDDLAWLQVTNVSGTESGTVKVDIQPLGMAVGTYTGAVKFTSINAANSPQLVNVTMTVYASQSDANPFGSFDTPVDGSTVMSSIPVTGWALDDIGIDKVTIWRNAVTGEGSGEIYIGDAVQVEGPRPDVEQAFPTYPMSYKGGWGYMLLTNMLPNGGNGPFTLHAYAKDLAGRQVKLGSKTITCDNAHAVKPFGAIDTPGQGGEATGSNFRNQGWALTPMPNQIPTNGSTISVWINGQNIGNVIYNIYRLDIATLFPGYANSSGAMGCLDFDTRTYESGLHTIQWVATDNAGNTDGIGSRYFYIQNAGYISQSAAKADTTGSIPAARTRHHFSNLREIPLEQTAPIKMTVGYKNDAEPRTIPADKNGIIHITVPQDERIVLDLSRPSAGYYTGYLQVMDQLRPLPPGTSLDSKTGILYWQPGPASFGKYQLVLISTDTTGITTRKEVTIEVAPKFAGK